jgi:hypothetical protein
VSVLGFIGKQTVSALTGFLPFGCFSEVFPLEICDLVAKETDAYAVLCLGSTLQYLPGSRYWKWKEVTTHEIRAVVAAEGKWE